MELTKKVMLENKEQAQSLIERFRKDESYYGFELDDIKEYPCVVCYEARSESSYLYPTIDWTIVYQSDFFN